MKRAAVTAFVLVMITAFNAGASEDAPGLTVRGGFTGNWSDPVANRQGIQIEVIDSRRAVIAWFTYTESGDPVWVFGTGEIENATIRADMVRFRGGTFPPDQSDPDAIESEAWGELELTFEDCNSGRMRWTPVLPGFEPGEVDIRRITPIDGLRCGQAEMFERTVQLSLDAGPGRWRALFADFTDGTREAIEAEAEAEWTGLPAPLSSRRGFMLAGTNFSDDLAMMLTAPLGGLRPDRDYRLEFDLSFATEVPKNCAGIGGSPGEGVTVKVGASTVEPAVVEQGEDMVSFRFNIDKGNQTAGGADAMVVGDMTNSQDCQENGFPGTWEVKTVTGRDREFIARTDATGRLWVYALSDSGFEGRTTFFVTDFTVRLQPLAAD